MSNNVVGIAFAFFALLGVGGQAIAQQPAAVPRFTFHGRPFFPIGLYNYAAASGVATESDTAMKEMSEAGFNTLLQYDHSPAWEHGQAPTTVEFLNRAASYHIAIVDEIWTYNLSADNWIGMQQMQQPGSALANEINVLKGNRDLLGWETFDEAFGYRGATDLSLTQGYRFVKRLDPDHPILSNENPINAPGIALAESKWLGIGDCHSCDWYPVDPTWAKRPWPLSGVPNNLDYLEQIAPSTPIYMILQGCPIAGAAPSFSDCRNIMYRSIIHGAAASIWWGTYQLKPSDQLWLDIKRCAGELHDLEAALADGQVDAVVRQDAATGASYATDKLRLSDPNLEAIEFTLATRHRGAEHYVIVANKSATDSVSASILASDWNHGRKTTVLFETYNTGRARNIVPSSEGAWRDTFTPNEVHVYTDR